jgi:hypothetical protein
MVAVVAQETVDNNSTTETAVASIKPEEAANHYGQTVTIKMSVESSKLLKDQNLCFLNSKRNHRDPDDLAIVLKEKGLHAFAEFKVDDPAKFFRGKTIAVTVKIEKFKDKPQIVVEKVDQIRVIVAADSTLSAPESTPSDPPPAPAASSKPPADDGGH